MLGLETTPPNHKIRVLPRVPLEGRRGLEGSSNRLETDTHAEPPCAFLPLGGSGCSRARTPDRVGPTLEGGDECPHLHLRKDLRSPPRHSDRTEAAIPALQMSALCVSRKDRFPACTPSLSKVKVRI